MQMLAHAIPIYLPSNCKFSTYQPNPCRSCWCQLQLPTYPSLRWRRNYFHMHHQDTFFESYLPRAGLGIHSNNTYTYLSGYLCTWWCSSLRLPRTEQLLPFLSSWFYFEYWAGWVDLSIPEWAPPVSTWVGRDRWSRFQCDTWLRHTVPRWRARVAIPVRQKQRSPLTVTTGSTQVPHQGFLSIPCNTTLDVWQYSCIGPWVCWSACCHLRGDQTIGCKTPGSPLV